MGKNEYMKDIRFFEEDREGERDRFPLRAFTFALGFHDNDYNTCG